MPQILLYWNSLVLVIIGRERGKGKEENETEDCFYFALKSLWAQYVLISNRNLI